MVNTRYANAFKEVDYYLKGIREEDIEKIPNKLKEFIKVNASEDYLVDFDYNKPLLLLNNSFFFSISSLPNESIS